MPENENAVALLVVAALPEDLAGLRSISEEAGWRLHEVASNEEALAALEQHPFPVVISERDLPGGDWRDLLDALRYRPRPPYLIVASRQADMRLWAEVLNLGGYDVLATPFRAGEVRRVVHLGWLRWQRERAGRAGSGAALVA
ncbi:MAG: response regulator [Acidobacteria bacterium]|nr:response regulator [Acidobacteriota bacterium]